MKLLEQGNPRKLKTKKKLINFYTKNLKKNIFKNPNMQCRCPR